MSDPRERSTLINGDATFSELVICSLEAWDEVWRRNQFLVAALLARDSRIRILFVEPPRDVPFELMTNRQVRVGRGLRRLPDPGGGRLWVFEPTKWLPRVVGPFADAALVAGIRHATRTIGFRRPVLWINDPALAPLAARTRWSTLYDVTDDWLLASCLPRELARRERNEGLLLRHAAEVVVCSPALVATKGSSRPVHLVPNAVDVQHLRSVRSRPIDFPVGQVVCYVGTLHVDRLDVDLSVELARRLNGRASLVFVGPDALDAESRRRLLAEPAITLLGARPYGDVPSYLQHADVLVTPHVVTPFTESLDPIKAYEYRSVGRPVVATPVAGFRELDSPVVVAQGSAFVDAVLEALVDAVSHPGLMALPIGLPTWETRVEAMYDLLESTAGSPWS